ncbi:HNH endonuclease [Puia dinghuensis]|uniref:HNH endonuclease 5 domain-containing protein n=1 Tax=Puia dinghuensis TaxID=1792502 RepID=A0A8J2UB36_9BACT|nr:HNH endonuclease [Puia dinghuensis]GGA92339.1 hypothetical protein GCM10011511_14680 [Puia dinghuensis]
MEFEFTFELKATWGSANYCVSGPETKVDAFVEAFLPVFEGCDGISKNIKGLQKNTPELYARMQAFIDEYSKGWPHLQGVLAFLRKLTANEPFLFLPNLALSQRDRMILHTYLRSEKEGKPFQQLFAETDELFGDLLKRYQLRVLGKERYFVGEPVKEKRKCRFCGKGIPDTTFDSRAHAISESIGNKNLILHDECDGCNAKYGQGIELDIAAYFAFIRTFYGIKGKGGVKPLTGKNFNLTNTDQLRLSFGDGFEFKFGESETSFSLDIPWAYSPQNMFKALCKYFLSLVAEERLVYFSKTIEWINGDVTTEKLPKIAVLFTNIGFKMHPEMALYGRLEDDQTLPYAIGDFSLATFRFIFIVPFTEKDDRSFVRNEDFDHFWNTFKHFNKAEGWTFEDFSGNPKKDQVAVLRVSKKTN